MYGVWEYPYRVDITRVIPYHVTGVNVRPLFVGFFVCAYGYICAFSVSCVLVNIPMHIVWENV